MLPHTMDEIKYLKPSASDAEVQESYRDAVAQLHQYATAHPFVQECGDHQWKLHTVALVVKGWQVAHLEEVTAEH